MGGVGSGGSTQAALPSFGGDVINNLKTGYGFQENQYNKFVNQDALLSAAKTGALGFFGGLGGLTGPLMSALQGPGGVAETIANRGALSPEAQRLATQQARLNYGGGTFGGAGAGSMWDPGEIASEVLNREAARQGRFNTALGQAEGIGSSVQGLQTSGLNQLIGVGNAAVGQFTGLTNPIGTQVANFVNALTETRLGNAQLAAKTEQAGKQNTMDWVNLGLSGAGKIIGGIAMSDERLKTKIRDTGIETKEGVPLKTFEYKTRPGVTILGVLAQDVEKKAPESVVEEPLTGIKMVDITRFPMFQVGKGT